MATRAVYTFVGFPDQPECHFYLHHDGYPTGAAWRFATALRLNPEASAFLDSFLITQPTAEGLADPEQAADSEYRYRILLLSSTPVALELQCWRRLPDGTIWHPRCSPMPLTLFIERFLPGGIRR